MLLCVLAAALASTNPVAATPAAPRTLRLELVHSGDASEERFTFQGLVREGPWPGNPARPIDDTNLGSHRVLVRDQSGRVLYSRGFSTIFGEWATTEEAKRRSRAFSLSLRFPEPAVPAAAEVEARGVDGDFRRVYSVTIDPRDPAIDSSDPKGVVWAVLHNGPPAQKVDLVLLGDGYTPAEMDKWHRDARRIAELLFAESPFAERRRDFNVWAVDTPSAESGITRPSTGVYLRSALRATYDAFGSERYVLAFDEERVREAAAAAPYDAMAIVVNSRTYGGGGIFNLYATVAADNAFTPYVFVHEFAHHFAGLADEYYTSDVAYESDGSRPETWEPNVSASPLGRKWSELLTPGTPLPTPWNKQAFEDRQKEIQARRKRIRAERRPEEEMEALFREEQREMDALLSAGPYARVVGAFEGAMYQATGYYRGQANCMMFTRRPGFCAVCRRALGRVIDLYAGE